MATASHQNPPTPPIDGARVIGRVISLPTIKDGGSPERNAFELGRDYERGLWRARLAGLLEATASSDAVGRR